MNDKQRDTVDRLVDAYEAMLERVHDAADTHPAARSVPAPFASLCGSADGSTPNAISH